MQEKTMTNKVHELAALICHGDAVLDPKKWLAEEASDLATRIPHLDEIPPQAILPLAKLVADGPSDARRLSLALDTFGMPRAPLTRLLAMPVECDSFKCVILIQRAFETRELASLYWIYSLGFL